MSHPLQASQASTLGVQDISSHHSRPNSEFVPGGGSSAPPSRQRSAVSLVARAEVHPSEDRATSSNAAAATASASAPTASQGMNRDGPRSSYYFGPPGKNSAFGTPPVGVIGRDKPREIVRVERDYSSGELCQFHPAFPLELEGRIQPTAFSETINDINVLLISAHDAGWACLDNSLAVLTLYLSPLVLGSRYKRQMKKLHDLIDEANQRTFNPVGLHIRDPVQSAFLFLEIEYF